MQTERPAYAYRDDPAVPPFDDAAPVAFMDGDCVLCTFGARMIARFDRGGRIRICPTQIPLGRAMLAHHGMVPEDPESWLFLIGGKAHGGIEGMIHAGRAVGGVGRLLAVLWLIPGPLRRWLYRRIARNRYGLFGRTDICSVPSPRLRSRLMTGA